MTTRALRLILALTSNIASCAVGENDGGEAIMGDKSPKSTQKKASQKETKSNDTQKKKNAVETAKKKQ